MFNNRYTQSLYNWLMSADDDQLKRGELWYEEALAECCRIADKYDLTAEAVAGVVAALSPRSRWERNLIDAELLCAGYSLGAEYADIKLPVYPSAKMKAWEILCGRPIGTVLLGTRGRGLKTYAFYTCITQNVFSYPVCIDTWMYKAAGFDDHPRWTTKVLYEEISKAVREVTRTYNASKDTDYHLGVCQVQAIIWLTIREATEETVQL